MKLTNEEIELIKQALTSVQLQGNYRVVVDLTAQIAAILEKLDKGSESVDKD